MFLSYYRAAIFLHQLRPTMGSEFFSFVLSYLFDLKLMSGMIHPFCSFYPPSNEFLLDRNVEDLYAFEETK